MPEPLITLLHKIGLVLVLVTFGLGAVATSRGITDPEALWQLVGMSRALTTAPSPYSRATVSADLRGVAPISESGRSVVGLTVLVGTSAIPFDDSDHDGVILVPASLNGQFASIRSPDGTILLEIRLQLDPDRPQKVVVPVQ